MKALQKTNFKRQPGKTSPTKPTISNSVQRKQQNRTFPDAIRNHKLASGAFSHHMFLKMSEEQRNNTPKPIANISLLTENKKKFNNFARGATN